MHRVGGVYRRHPVAYALEKLHAVLDGRASAFSLEPCVESQAFDEFHHEIRAAKVLTESVYPNHVRVADSRHSSRLDDEACSERIADKLIPHELDRHTSIKDFVVGENDRSHSADSKKTPNAIVFADQRTRFEAVSHAGQSRARDQCGLVIQRNDSRLPGVRQHSRLSFPLGRSTTVWGD